jgi:glycosyltransferase involved in cell wall biosynthesis
MNTRALMRTAGTGMGMAGVAQSQPVPAEEEAHVCARPLQVLFVLNNLDIGGSERKVLRLVRRLHEKGVAVGMACLNGPHTLRGEVPAGVPLWQLGRRGRFSIVATWRLRRIVAQCRPATLVSVNLYPSLYVLVCAALVGAPRPRTVGLVNTSTFVQSFARRSFYRALLPRLRATIHGSEAQRASWFDRGAAAARRSAVIYNGVDLAEFDRERVREQAEALRARLAIPPGRFVIGNVGRLSREKNHEVLLQALQRLRSSGVEAHLLLVGDGAMRETLRERAAELGVRSRVAFAGALSDVRPALAAMDVFVLPSVETFSNAALEAMAMRLPVILSSIGGAREMVDDGVEGFVVTPTEMHARLPALLAALCADVRRRARLGTAARERVERSFSLDAMVARYEGVLTEVQGHV